MDRLMCSIKYLGNGMDISVNELTKTIISILGKSKKYPVTYKKARPGDQRHMRASIAKLKTAIGWKPHYNLKKGLQKTIQWAQENK